MIKEDVSRQAAQSAMVKAGILEGAFAEYSKRMAAGQDEILTRDELTSVYKNLSSLFHEIGWALATALDGDLK